MDAPEQVAPTVATTGVLEEPCMHGVPCFAAPSSATPLEQPELSTTYLICVFGRKSSNHPSVLSLIMSSASLK